MKHLGVVVGVVGTMACGGANHGAPIDAGPSDAGVADAGPDAIPHVPPCQVLGLPGPPAIAAPIVNNLTLLDVDGNGTLDLIGVYNGVSVLLGNGDGSFGAGIESPTDLSSGYTYAAAFADLDGDGKVDLVEGVKGVDGTPLSVNVWLGDGAGDFTPLGNLPIASAGIALADLDGDGKPDLVRIDPATSTMAVDLGNGDGTFGPDTGSAVGVNASGVTLADLDGDGHPDAIVSNYSDSTISVLRGNGDGSFQPKVDYLTTPANTVVATDLDGDGKPDIVAAGNYTVSVLVNKGDGTLQAHVDYVVSDFITSFAVADIDLDGKPDVVATAVGTPGTTLVFAGNGDGTLQPPAITQSLPYPSALVLGDVDSDNAPDILVGDPQRQQVSVLESNGGGGFLGATTYPMGPQSGGVIAADLDADGYGDLVLTSGDSLDVALGRSEGRFENLVSYHVAGPGGPVVFTDVNGDGIGDLVVSSFVITDTGSGSGISVLLGNGDGTFQNPIGSLLTVPGAFEFAIGDFDGDGKPDLVIGANGTDGAGVAMYRGNGDGTFHPGVDLASYQGTIAQVALADFDGDGKPDIVVGHQASCVLESGCRGTPGIDVLLNNGHGLVASTIVSPLPFGVFAVGDLDGDGKQDVVASSFGTTVARGNGDGTLQVVDRYGTDATANVQIVDLNGDGKLDVVTWENITNPGNPNGLVNVTLWPGSGDGTLQPGLIYADAVNGAIAFADVNRDGRLDLVTQDTTFEVWFARCLR